jgi:hypothetical protein
MNWPPRWRSKKKAELVTADHEFKSVAKEIKINWLAK